MWSPFSHSEAVYLAVAGSQEELHQVSSNHEIHDHGKSFKKKTKKTCTFHGHFDFLDWTSIASRYRAGNMAVVYTIIDVVTRRIKM